MVFFKKKPVEKLETADSFHTRLSRSFSTTTKQLIWLFSINSVLWIWCSYFLAWFDKVQIAESLSSTVCTIIIGQTLGYLITKTVENVYKYNDVGGKSNTSALNKEGMQSEHNFYQQPSGNSGDNHACGGSCNGSQGESDFSENGGVDPNSVV